MKGGRVINNAPSIMHHESSLLKYPVGFFLVHDLLSTKEIGLLVSTQERSNVRSDAEFPNISIIFIETFYKLITFK